MCTLRLHFLTVFHKRHLSKSPRLPSCTKILLTVRARPCSYHVKLQRQNIWNNVQQIILIQLTSVGLAHACSTRELFDHCGASLADHILSWHTDHARGISNGVCQPEYLHRCELSLTRTASPLWFRIHYALSNVHWFVVHDIVRVSFSTDIKWGRRLVAE